MDAVKAQLDVLAGLAVGPGGPPDTSPAHGGFFFFLLDLGRELSEDVKLVLGLLADVMSNTKLVWVRAVNKLEAQFLQQAEASIWRSARSSSVQRRNLHGCLHSSRLTVKLFLLWSRWMKQARLLTLVSCVHCCSKSFKGCCSLAILAQGFVYERRMTQRNPTRGQPVVNTTGPRGISVFEHLSQSRQLYEHPGNPLEPERSSS